MKTQHCSTSTRTKFPVILWSSLVVTLTAILNVYMYVLIYVLAGGSSDEESESETHEPPTELDVRTEIMNSSFSRFVFVEIRVVAAGGE